MATLFKICLFSIGLMLACCESIPSLITRGSHYAVGLSVGRTFKKNILAYYSEHPYLLPVWLPWSRTPAGQKVVQGFLDAAQHYYPQYVEELHGMSVGANISFIEMFLANHYVEIAAILGNNIADSCSDLHVNHPDKDCVILAHNEDNIPLIQNKAYFLTATITDHSGEHVLEQFTAYCYPGQLPGNAFGFNNHGLVVTVNGLYPKLVEIGRVGRSFLNRAMLVARNLSEAINDVRNSSAYGLNANIGILPDRHRGALMYNVEVAPNANGTDTIISVYQINKSTSIEGKPNGNYFHVNKYRRIMISEIPKRIESSIHRTTRIRQFPPPTNLESICAILGDTKDQAFPIYRTPRVTDNEATLATALFDLQRCTMSVYMDNPKTSKGPLNVFPLPCAFT